MRHERYSYRYQSRQLGSSLRRRGSWLAAAALALAVLLLSLSGHPLATRLRVGMREGATPVLTLLNTPLQAATTTGSGLRDYFAAVRENRALHAENEALKRWQAVALTLRAENEQLRALAGYNPVKTRYVTAQVIAQSPEAYGGSLTLDAGETDGLAPMQPVIDDTGLIGRVLEVGPHSASVLLLTDTTSRIPVISANSRQHAILAGTGEALLRLTFVGGNAERITLGEQVLTTNEAGLIPESVMVGTVFGRDKEGLLVKPPRPLTHAELVRVMIVEGAGPTKPTPDTAAK